MDRFPPECETQFFTGVNSRPLAKSAADLHQHGDQHDRRGGEQQRRDDERDK